MRKDGDYVHKGLKFGKVTGNAHKIVVAERVVLNFMQRMSGIATLTKVFCLHLYSLSSDRCGHIHIHLVIISKKILWFILLDI